MTDEEKVKLIKHALFWYEAKNLAISCLLWIPMAIICFHSWKLYGLAFFSFFYGMCFNNFKNCIMRWI